MRSLLTMRIAVSGELCLAILLGVTVAGAAETSRLWGASGECWDPQGRLPDVSYAGYHRGDSSIPAPAVTTDVRSFGAVGDGIVDDTAAFRAAITATAHGVIGIPAGRFKITDKLVLNRSDVVLRGDGAAKTTLYFPETLSVKNPEEIANRSGRRTSMYSWSGGFLSIVGREGSSSVPITNEGPQGLSTLRVAHVAGLAVGERIEVQVHDDDLRTLSQWVYDGDAGDIGRLNRQVAKMIVVITAIDAATNTIAIDRKLRFPLRASWEPHIVGLAERVREVGIEALTCEFPPTPYLGHFTERGYNAIAIHQAMDCWVRDVAIINAESGIFCNGSHCTLTGLDFSSQKTTDGDQCSGHHGIMLGGSDNLISRFHFRQRFIHDLTVQNVSCAGNVFAGGRGIDLSLDHHCEGPFANVFTDLDCGAGSRIWISGGASRIGRHAGMREVFWNIRSDQPLSLPPQGWGPDVMTLVGMTLKPFSPIETKAWIEAISPAQLQPQDIHAAQLRRRMMAGAK